MTKIVRFSMDRFYINSKMFRSPKSPLPIAKSNLSEVGAEDATYCDGNDQRSTILYVPMQVFMSDSFDTAANNNSSITSVMKLHNDTTVLKKREIHEFQESSDNKIWSDQPTLITKKSNDDPVVIKKGEIHESQESSDNEIWSPLMDGIVDATGNCRKSGKDSEKVKAVKFLDVFIDRILYGPRDPSKSRLPVFEEICPE